MQIKDFKSKIETHRRVIPYTLAGIIIIALFANAYAMATTSLNTTGSISIGAAQNPNQLTGGLQFVSGSISNQACTLTSSTSLGCPVTMLTVGQSAQLTITVSNTSGSTITVSVSATTNQPSLTITPSGSNPSSIGPSSTGTFTFTIAAVSSTVSSASYTVNITG